MAAQGFLPTAVRRLSRGEQPWLGSATARCGRRRRLLSALCDGEASLSVRKHLLDHLVLCPECRAFFRAASFFRAALTEAVQPPPPG